MIDSQEAWDSVFYFRTRTGQGEGVYTKKVKSPLPTNKVACPEAK
jgi:hypothetical protein